MQNRDYNGPPWPDDLTAYEIPKEFLANKETKEARKSICISCDKLNKFNMCTECYCVMPAKWWLALAECPIQKW